MGYRDRPTALRVALIAALLAVCTDLLALISLRELLGSGWLFLVVLSTFKYMIYLFMLGLAYNGRGWVRFVYLFGTALTVYAMSQAGPAAFRDPFMIAFLAFSVVAIGAWFSDSSQDWYRRPLIADT